MTAREGPSLRPGCGRGPQASPSLPHPLVVLGAFLKPGGCPGRALPSPRRATSLQGFRADGDRASG